MDEYIGRESIYKTLSMEKPLGWNNDDLAELFREAKPADVTPVRHGQWEKKSGLYSCSECGKTCPYDVQADVIEYWACNYCPHCGAKMYRRIQNV